MYYFADVASYQPDTLEYFTAVKNAGASAVVIKLSEGCQHGTNYRNPKAQNQIANALKAGLKVHFYHFFRGTSVSDAQCEARFFIDYAKSLNTDPDSVYVCDVEASPAGDKATYTTIVNAFLQQVKDLGYNNVDTYSFTSYINSYLNINDLISKNIWQADYNKTRGDIGYIAGSWQYTSTLNVAGVNTDFSIDYNGFYTYNAGQSSNTTTDTTTTNNTSLTTFTDDLGVTWYKESGTFKLNTSIKLRWGATTSSTVITTLKAGDTVKYDAFCYAGGYVWIRQPRGNGQYAYLATGTAKNGQRVDYWGTFS